MRSENVHSEHPPPIPLYQIYLKNQRLRFIATSAQVDTNITYAGLLNTILFASTATAPYTVFDAVRIRFVEVWSPSQGTTSSNPPLPSTCSVAFANGTIDGDFAVKSDTSMTIHPAHVKARPSVRSLAANWQNGVATGAFILNCPIGSVIDVCLDLRDLPGSAAAAVNASIGATVGSVFYRGLDALGIGTTTMPPVGNVAAF